MFTTIRSRLITTAILIGLAIFSLWPRQITRRERDTKTGTIRNVVEKKVPLKEGLDLQGGIHLALEVDQSKGGVADPKEAINRALTVIRTRIDEFGVAEPLVQKEGDTRIIVEMPGQGDPARAKDIVQRSAYLEFRIVDMQGQFRNAISAIDAELRKAGIRPGTTGGKGPTGAVERLLGNDTAKGKSKAKAKADTATDANAPGALASLLRSGASSQSWDFLVPEEDFPRVDSLINLPIVQRTIPRGVQLLWGVAPISAAAVSYRPLYAVESRPIITGEYLADAKAQIDPVYNQSIVTFALTRSGGRIFGRETARHIGDFMAIILDGRVQGAPPVIRSQINQRGQIELGSATLQQANDLALVLRAGALPAPLVIVEERTVGPSLGQDSIHDGITAGLVGTALVILIMVAYYRVSGVLAVTGLAIYLLLTFGGLAFFGATLTLPGLAGIVVSIGLAVDANVLIFERIREELELGKTVRLAIDEGFRRAMNAIVDSNVCAIVTAALLFQFGTGPVKGFAITLILGIIASMITAIFITRTLFMIWLQRRPNMTTLSI
jgi:preprotein translocase subunit SecD